jgi:hypothetical protein
MSVVERKPFTPKGIQMPTAAMGISKQSDVDRIIRLMRIEKMVDRKEVVGVDDRLFLSDCARGQWAYQPYAWQIEHDHADLAMAHKLTPAKPVKAGIVAKMVRVFCRTRPGS